MKMRCGIHPRVENANNADRCVEDSIVDDVLTSSATAQPRRNAMPISTEFGVNQKLTNGFRDSLRVAILLPLSPGSERVIKERLKVGLRFSCEFDLTG